MLFIQWKEVQLVMVRDPNMKYVKNIKKELNYIMDF